MARDYELRVPGLRAVVVTVLGRQPGRRIVELGARRLARGPPPGHARGARHIPEVLGGLARGEVLRPAGRRPAARKAHGLQGRAAQEVVDALLLRGAHAVAVQALRGAPGRVGLRALRVPLRSSGRLGVASPHAAGGGRPPIEVVHAGQDGRLQPAKHVEVQHPTEGSGQHGAVVLCLVAAEADHEHDQKTMRQEGQNYEHLCKPERLKGVHAPVVRSYAANDGAEGKQELHLPELPDRERHVELGHCLSQDTEEQHAVGRCRPAPDLDQDVAEDVVGQRQKQLVDTHAQGDPGEGVVGLPVDHRLAGELDVAQPGHLRAVLAAELRDAVARPLVAPGVCGRGLALGCRLLRGCDKLLLAAREEGHAQQLPALHVLELGPVGAAGLDLLPGGDRQPDELRQQPGLVALRRDRRVHREPHGEQQEHEGPCDPEGKSHHQPVWRIRWQPPLAPQDNGETKQKHVDKEIDVHLVFSQ
mmetsp:Transcript_44671/g.127439  ORF Transcript_44671/g.127439 Transcript_44671/m.127439 type:complete len:474 (-) Transcript_44671:385-1806(-)